MFLAKGEGGRRKPSASNTKGGGRGRGGRTRSGRRSPEEEGSFGQVYGAKQGSWLRAPAPPRLSSIPTTLHIFVNMMVATQSTMVAMQALPRCPQQSGHPKLCKGTFCRRPCRDKIATTRARMD